MRRNVGLWAVFVVAVCAVGTGGLRAAPAARVTLRVRQQPLAKVVAELSQALGAPVRIEGERKTPVTVDVSDVSGREALEAVATAVDGEWQRLIVLSGQRKGGGAGRFPSGRLVTLSLEDVSVATAAGTVAKAAAARLELEGVPDKSLSITAESEAVETVLDRLAKSAGLFWQEEFVLTVAEPAAATANASKAAKSHGATVRSGATRGRVPGLGGSAKVGPAPIGTASIRKQGELPNLGGQLSAGMPADRALGQDSFYKYIFSLPRTKREPFVQQLADELKQTSEGHVTPSNSMQAQMLFERRLRRQAIIKMIVALPAAKKRELQPILDALSQGMPTGTQAGTVGAVPHP
jgi:hypothetical protein